MNIVQFNGYAGGVFTPGGGESVGQSWLTYEHPVITFTYTPLNETAHTISFSNSAGFTNPSAVTYQAAPPAGTTSGAVD